MLSDTKTAQNGTENFPDTQTQLITVIDGKWTWVGHSHPTTSKLISSIEDINALKLFTWQNESCIIDLEGNIYTFTSNEQDWYNDLLGVK